MKKQTYTPPKTEILELNYAEPVCVTASSNSIDNYELVDGSGIVWN